MILNFGSVSGNVIEMGYTGAYTGGGGQTYPYLVPYGDVDTNSSFYGILVTENSTWGVVTPFQHFTVDHTAGQAEVPPYGNDINDHGTAEAGYIGLDFEDRRIKYADGTLSAVFRVNIDIQEAVADVIGPVIDSVSVPAAGTYTEGQVLSFTGNWNEGATVTGTPAINFDLGGSARQANYISGTGTASSVFTYTVQSGDEDTDGITVTSLTLDGGTIKDTAGNDADLALNSVGDTSGVLVDGIAPQVPQGTWTIGTITKGQTTASLTPAYSGSDADSFEYTVNGTDWTTFTGTISLTGLTEGTNYPDAAVRAVNATGNGASESFAFTTEAAPEVPQGTWTIGTIITYQTAVSLTPTYSGSDANSFEYTLDGSSWITFTGTITIGQLTADTFYANAAVRAVNATGNGASATFNFTTASATGASPALLSKQRMKMTLDATRFRMFL